MIKPVRNGERKCVKETIENEMIASGCVGTCVFLCMYVCLCVK